MKNTRAIVMIVLSLVAGVVAVILAARWVGQKAAENTTPVVVSMRDLDLGAPLAAATLQTVPWPVGNVPEGVFQDAKKLEGRVVKTPIFKGEPILEQKLAAQGSKGGLPSLIQSGKRAISVKVNEVVGVAGFTLPGSYVDIMVNTMETRDAKGARDAKEISVSKIVLTRILVLAVAQEANRDETKPKVVSAVTLEVTPEEAEKIDLARSIGTLSLVLRNPLDRAEAPTAGMRRDELLNKEPVPAVVAASAPVQVASAPQPVAKPRRPAVLAAKAPPAMPPSDAKVEVIRGVQKGNSEF